MNSRFPVVMVAFYHRCVACQSRFPRLTLFAWGLGLLAPMVAAAGATATGRVFVDLDGNGQADTGEPGLAGIAVSDGHNVARTEANGDYRLEVDDAPFVFVVLPRGYRAAQRFYADAKAAGPIDFALVDWPESRSDVVRFVQISDTHVMLAGKGDVDTFIADIEEINALLPKAAFVIATGDLVNRGEEAGQFDDYIRGTKSFKPLLFNLPGNHDAARPEGLQHYHHYLGPDYYSFNAGNCHFIFLNSMRYKEGLQQAWIEKDLAAAPPGATLICGMHYLPTPEQIQYFASLGAKAVLSGHWHGNRVQESLGVFDLNTPTLRFGGIDRHPRSFRVIEVANGQVTNELRLGGFHQHVVVVAPAGPCVASAGRLSVVVNTYDSSVNIEAVECAWSGQTIALHQTGTWSWTGEVVVPPGLSGGQSLIAKIRATNGETWEAESAFTLPSGATAVGESRPPLQLKWAAPTGGFIGFSSPCLDLNRIAIGVDDKGDLKHCGVLACDAQGRQLWFFNADSGIKNNIAAADGRVFATSVAGWLYAIDEASGQLLWKTELDRASARWEIAATLVADGVVHVGSNSYVAAFDAKTGSKFWETRQGTRGDWDPTSYTVPMIVQGKVLLPHLRWGTFALDARTGQLAWQLEGTFNGCVVHEDTVYTLREGYLTAIALESGKVLRTSKEKINGTASKPLWAGDRIIVGTADGQVCALSPQDGRVLWQYQTGQSLTSLQPYGRGGSDVNSSPAVYGDTVYVGASDGEVHAIALADGQKRGSYRLGVPIASSPVIADDTLYIGGYDGNLYAFTVSK